MSACSAFPTPNILRSALLLYTIPRLLWLAAGVIPVILALILWLRSSRLRWPLAEASLAGLVLTPIVLLAEILIAHAAPIERPLRIAVPILHVVFLALCFAFLWTDRHRFRAIATVSIRRVRAWWHAAPLLWRLFPILSACTLGFALLHASWNSGDIHDGGSYREVVAVASYQEGRVGKIAYPYADIADAYPRTIELIYSWTMLWTRSGVGFQAVNWFALVTLGLSGYVGAKRLGLRIRSRVAAFAAIVTTPMPAYLVGVIYNDLPAAAPVAAALAFMLPAARSWPGVAWSWSVLWVTIACLALGAASKLHAAIPAAVLCATRLAFMAFSPKPYKPPGFGPTLAGFSLAGAIGSIPYLRCWALYGSPFWPVEFRLGSQVIFPGVFNEQNMQVSTQGPWAHRWFEALFQFFQSASQDANGAFGVLFGALAVPASVLGAALAFRNRRFERVILGLACFYALLIPQATNLRYCLVPLVAGYLALVRVERLRAPIGRTWRTGAVALVAFLVAVNMGDYMRSVVWRAGSQLALGASLLDARRNRGSLETADWLRPGVHPRTYSDVQALTPPGTRLVYAVKPIPAFLYDVRYSYAVEFRPLTAGTDKATWLASLRQGDISGVLVYEHSTEHAAIQEQAGDFELILNQDNVPSWRRCLYFRPNSPQ